MPTLKPEFPFSTASINALPSPVRKTQTFKDSKTGTLSLYVTPGGVKTFFVRKRVKGRDERLIIGRFPDVSLEQARKKAAVFCGMIADRKDPLEEFRREKQDNKTFGQHFAEYLERYSKVHKKSWIYDEREINHFVKHWFNKRLSDIKKSDIDLLHKKIGRENGQTQANTIVRRLSAIYNKAIEWGWSGINPAKGIQKFKERSRDRFIMPNEMPFVIKALESDPNPDLKDYFKILLLTGARKTNALMMRWQDISFELKEWRIPETKNGDPLVLPLTEKALDILQKRKEASTSRWVFPQASDPGKHIREPIKAWKRILGKATLDIWSQDKNACAFLQKHKSKLKGYHGDELKVKIILRYADMEKAVLPPSLLDLRIHDIRRTFGSYQALTGASLPVIGRSLGHKSLRSTQIYARLNLDPIRASIEKATDAMLLLD
jgi:integrase